MSTPTMERPEPVPDAAGFKRNREGRPAKPLFQPGGHEADDAGMPAFGGRHHHRASLLQAERSHRLSLRLRQRVHLDRLAFAV